MKRFQIGDGPIYSLADIEQLSLKDLLVLKKETTELGDPVDMDRLYRMQDELDKLDDDARKQHPDAPLLLAVGVWAARLRSGEQLSFADAIDFPLRQLRFLPDPTDRKKPAARPTQARRASGRAGAKRTAAASGKTSKKASTAG